MSELLTMVVQIAFGLGLAYGMVTVLRYWSETVPMGASADELVNRPTR